MILRGRHSIMANFPAPQVFAIGDHACVSLKETVLILAAHHGGFEFAWDADTKQRNMEGLNGTPAASAVYDELKMINHKDIEHTGIGWVYI